ncbi:MAG: hypothetical protein U1C33_07600, partial [Candidatus Cloacimonadaceae bacterium]|nr:hypothetical protein [Candidatus Cloacimonadaceae bacterium]
MKRCILLTLFFVISVAIFAAGLEISRSELNQLASRKAAAEWGNVFPMEPVPYYGADDEVIAYCYPFSIDQPPPDTEQIIQRSEQAWKDGNRDLAYGVRV